MNSDGAILPPMLSPTLPSDWELPEPLSPTIPSEFDCEPSFAESEAGTEKLSSQPASSTAPRQLKKGSHGEIASRTSSTASVDSKPKKPVRKMVILHYPPRKLTARTNKLAPEPEKTLKASTVAPSTAATSTTSDDNPKYKSLRVKMHYWVEMARKKKHEADAAAANRMHHQAAVSGLDSAICFIRAFDLEDRADQVVSREPHARSWTTLVPYLGKMATYLESIDSDIAGMCYQVLAVVNIRIAVVRQGSKDAPLAAQRAIQEFRRGLALLPLSLIEEKYNLRWASTKLNPKGCDPCKDRAMLPLHVNTSPQEAAALALNMGREWAHQEGISYTWDAAAPL